MLQTFSLPLCQERHLRKAKLSPSPFLLHLPKTPAGSLETGCRKSFSSVLCNTASLFSRAHLFEILALTHVLNFVTSSWYLSLLYWFLPVSSPLMLSAAFSMTGMVLLLGISLLFQHGESVYNFMWKQGFERVWVFFFLKWI